MSHGIRVRADQDLAMTSFAANARCCSGERTAIRLHDVNDSDFRADRTSDMTPNEILAELRRRPFEAFRLHLSDGSSYDVRSPELCMVGINSVVIGLTKSAGE